jgi:general secretion pathway protein I
MNRQVNGRPPAQRSRQTGFLLLEVLVAFLIAALALGVLMEGAGEGARATRNALDSDEAVVRARSRLAALEHGGLVAGKHEGDDGGGFRWRTEVTPLQTATDIRSRMTLPPDSPLLQQTLYAVRVEIEWQAANGVRHFSLQSERLGPAAPGAS